MNPFKKVTSAFAVLFFPLSSVVPQGFSASDSVAQGAKVINMSLRWFTDEIAPSIVTALQDAINAARAAGVVVVVAAGNEDVDAEIFIPISLSGVIGVAATTSSDTRASFSNFGTSIDVSAPGVDIYSTLGSSSYAFFSGTSMSSPIVAALAALILSQDPLADGDDVMRRLQFSSVDLGASGYDTIFGCGRIDAFKALSYDYYADGTIKTQWLEAPDENGYTRLDFDIEGRLIGGASAVASSGLSALSPVISDLYMESILPPLEPELLQVPVLIGGSSLLAVVGTPEII